MLWKWLVCCLLFLFVCFHWMRTLEKDIIARCEHIKDQWKCSFPLHCLNSLHRWLPFSMFFFFFFMYQQKSWKLLEYVNNMLLTLKSSRFFAFYTFLMFHVLKLVNISSEKCKWWRKQQIFKYKINWMTRELFLWWTLFIAPSIRCI